MSIRTLRGSRPGPHLLAECESHLSAEKVGGGGDDKVQEATEWRVQEKP